jgi:dihydroorotase
LQPFEKSKVLPDSRVFDATKDVHLRQGKLCELVAPHVAQGGVSLCYVMPNLVPPLTTTSAAVSYRETLEKLCPNTHFLMTLFLSLELTVEEVRKAHAAGIKGVKSYPRGVTTNSGAGVESYERYYDVFAEMEKLGLVLNLHGEVPSSAKHVGWTNKQLRSKQLISPLGIRTSAYSTLKQASYHICTRCTLVSRN